MAAIEESEPCPYCSAMAGTRSVRLLVECRACGRIVRERHVASVPLYGETVRDVVFSAPLQPSFSTDGVDEKANLKNGSHLDKGSSIMAAFSVSSLETLPLFSAATSSMSGQLAELERVFGDALYAKESPNNPYGTTEYVRAYLQLLDVASLLGLDHDIVETSALIFQDCCSVSMADVRNNSSIEALAVAAMMLAMKEAHETRTLSEVSAAAGIPPKEVTRNMKLLSDTLKSKQPLTANSIARHMPRFCGILQLQKSIQDLATHIGEVVISRNLCTRRNPISISAAAIYLSCLLEDKPRTQAEICKATGLTEVTLRKVYRELSKNLDDLLPPYYKPKVPPEKAFSMTAALGRTATPRQTAAQGETETEHGTGSEGSVPSAPRWPSSIAKSVERPDTDGQVGEAPSSVGVSTGGGGAVELKAGKKACNRGTGEIVAVRERQLMREDAQYNDFEERVGNGKEGEGQVGALSTSSQQPTSGPIGTPSGLASFQLPGLPFANLREMPLVWGPSHPSFAARPPEGTVRGGERGESVPTSLPMTTPQAVAESMALSGPVTGGPPHFNMAASQRDFGGSSADYKREGSHDRERDERREAREERQREERGGRTRQEGSNLDNNSQGNANLSTMRVPMPSSAAMNLGAFAAFPPNLWPIFAAGGGPSPSAWGAMLPPQLMPMGGGIPPIPPIPPILSDARNSVNPGSGTGGSTRGPGTPPGVAISGGLPPGFAEAMAPSTMLASHSGLPPMWPPFHMMFPPTAGTGGPDGAVQMPFGSFQDAMAIRGAMANGQGGPMFPVLNMGLAYPQALMEKQQQVSQNTTGPVAPPSSAAPSHDRAQ